MADAYSRMSGTVAALSVHQGCGLTNAMTGITEAAKSRTPLLVLAAEATQAAVELPRRPDGAGRAPSAPCRCASRRRRPRSPTPPRRTGRRATSGAPWCSTCRSTCRRPRSPAGAERAPGRRRRPTPPPTPTAWPGSPPRSRGASGRCSSPGAARAAPAAGQALEALAERLRRAAGHAAPSPTGCSTATRGRSASPAGSPRRWPAELIRGADLIVGWGCALNMWTMSHGALIGPDATVVQVDIEPDALGAHRPIDVGVVGDVRRPRRRAAAALPRRGPTTATARPSVARAHRRRSPLARRRRSRTRRRPTASTRASSAPRSTTCCPRERVVAMDSGNFQGYPSAYLVRARRVRLLHDPGVPVDRPRPGDGDRRRARPARPAAGRRARRRRRADGRQRARHRRPARAADGRRGLRRRRLRRRGAPLRPARPRPRHGRVPRDRHRRHRPRLRVRGGDRAHASTTSTPSRRWLAGPRAAPLLVDAKVVKDQPSWWLEEAFRGH